MASDDALGERLLQGFYRVALMQRAKRRRHRQRTPADTIDRVTLGAHALDQCKSKGARCLRTGPLLNPSRSVNGWGFLSRATLSPQQFAQVPSQPRLA